MIKSIVYITAYIFLIPFFYFLFLFLVWLFNYDHKQCSFYKYMYDEAYDDWSEEGKFCRVLSAIFPFGLIIILLYFFFKNTWRLLYRVIVRLLEKNNSKS